MRCSRQPRFLETKPTQISDVWEVQLSVRFWSAVSMVGRKRRMSYSSVTRYCIFRLIEKQNLRWHPILITARRQVREDLTSCHDKHRHMVCFYGEDIKFVRYAAMNLGVSVSTLIRIALWLYLPRLAMEIQSRRHVSAFEIFRLGIKRWQHVHHAAINNFGIPLFRRLAFSSFFPWQWWPPKFQIE